MILSLIDGARVLRRSKQDIPNLSLLLLSHLQGVSKPYPFRYKNRAYVRYRSATTNYVLLADDWSVIETELLRVFPEKKLIHNLAESTEQILGLLNSVIVDEYPHIE